MHIILGLFLIAHGVAHLVGFVSYWKIASFEEMPYKTTLLSDRVEIGDAGIRIVGVLWLLTGLAFAVIGVGIATLQPWWYPLIIYLVLFSLVMCVIGWPEARIGVLINVILLVLLVLANNFGWLQMFGI